jgi:hypothetical protein
MCYALPGIAVIEQQLGQICEGVQPFAVLASSHVLPPIKSRTNSELSS